MGLLGGFKAKFKSGQIRERKAKSSKSSDKNNIVCLKFNVISEFDSQPVDIPSTSQQNWGKTDVVRARKSPTVKPEAKSLFQEGPSQTTHSNGDVKNHIYERVKDVPAEPVEVKSESVDDEFSLFRKVRKDAPKPIEVPKEDDDFSLFKKVTPKSPVKKDAPNPEESKPKPVKKQAPKPIETEKESPPPPLPRNRPPSGFDIENEENKADAAFNSVTNSDSDDDDGNFKINFAGNAKSFVNDSDDEGNFKINLGSSPKSSHDDDDDDSFKIHVADHSKSVYSNYSSDDESSDEKPSVEHKFSPANYSSQAASIFFGDDEEPIVMRPRNIVLDDDDDDNSSSGSSADC